MAIFIILLSFFIDSERYKSGFILKGWANTIAATPLMACDQAAAVIHFNCLQGITDSYNVYALVQVYESRVLQHPTSRGGTQRDAIINDLRQNLNGRTKKKTGVAMLNYHFPFFTYFTSKGMRIFLFVVRFFSKKIKIKGKLSRS